LSEDTIERVVRRKPGLSLVDYFVQTKEGPDSMHCQPAPKKMHNEALVRLTVQKPASGRLVGLGKVILPSPSHGQVGNLSCPYGKKTHLRFRGREVYPTEGSCRFPLIVLQQTTQPFLATHNSVVPARPSIWQGEQELVLLALVIALLVVICQVLLQGPAQRPLPEQDELRQAFLFHRSHPAFRIGVQIRTPGWS